MRFVMMPRWALVPLLIIGAFFAVELGWFALVRLTSDWRAVTIRKLDFPEKVLPANGRVHIATYNICKGKGMEANTRPMENAAEMFGRLDAIAGLLVSEKADIVVLNELDFDSLPTGRINQAEYIARKAGFPFLVEQRDVDARTLLFFSEQSGNAVLSCLPIRSVRHVPLPGYVWWETLLGGKGNGALCEIEMEPGKSIQLLATHLESRSEPVRKESVRVIEHLRTTPSGKPFLVVGDLNSSPQVSLTDDGGKTAIGLLYSGGGYATLPTGQPIREDTTLASATTPYVIDWILVPADWRIIQKEVIRSPASDHWPVFMEVQISPPEARN